MTLQNAQGGATVGIPGGATVTIVDNDRLGTVQFSQPTARVQEDVASAALTVTRTGSTGGQAAVDYEIMGDTASVDQALTPLSGTVTFAARPGKPDALHQAAARYECGRRLHAHGPPQGPA